MSYLPRFLNQLSSVVGVARSNVCFDLGSANTRVSFRGKIVYDQPSCATFHEETASIVQLGENAVVSSDRMPGVLSTIFPIRQGYITDLTKVKAYLSAVINQALQAAQQRVVVTLAGTCAVSASLSPVEKQMLTRVLKQAGVSDVKLVPKPVAIFQTLPQPVSTYVCLICIGAQTTEIGLFVGGEARAMTTIYIGGDNFTQKIKELVRSECQGIVGWQSAQKLKHQQKGLSFTAKSKEEQTLGIRAKSLMTLNPTTVFLKKSSLQAAFIQVADELLGEISSFFAQQEPEVVTPALEQGIYITGGGSQLQGLVEYVGQQLKTEMVKSAKPADDVIKGLETIS